MSSPRIPLAIVVPVAAGLLLGGAIAIHRQSGSVPTPAQAGTSKPAGSGLILSSDHLDFGVMEIGQAVVRPLLLRNGGSDPIHVNIATAGSGWTVEPAELTLEPGGIQRVKVIGTRSDSGAIQGQIRIVTDRSKGEPLVVALEGGASAEGGALAANVEVDARGSTPGYGAAQPLPGPRVSAGSTQAGGYGYPTRGGSADPRVSVTSTRTSGAVGATGSRAGDSLNAGATGGTAPIVPFDPAGARPPRSMSDRPSTPSDDRLARSGEEPVPLNPRTATPETGSDPGTQAPVAGVSALVVSPSSTLHLLGTKNQFYAQQINVTGGTAGGSFSLGSPLQLPRIPLAFGQSMEFTQNGAAAGSYDAGSGQVTMQLPVSAVDSNGNSAPIVLSLTTGTIVTRNANGVLVSLTGQPRTTGSGQLRLVGIAKIPVGFRNGAEQQLVSIDVVGSLTFASPTSARNASDAASAGAQENL